MSTLHTSKYIQILMYTIYFFQHLLVQNVRHFVKGGTLGVVGLGVMEDLGHIDHIVYYGKLVD